MNPRSDARLAERIDVHSINAIGLQVGQPLAADGHPKSLELVKSKAASRPTPEALGKTRFPIYGSAQARPKILWASPGIILSIAASL